MASHNELGALGEELAVEFLEKHNLICYKCIGL